MSGSLEQLEDVFERMRAEAGWDTTGPLLWGYFFVDPEPSVLQRAAILLEGAAYRVVEIFRLEDCEEYMLHVEQIATHTPASLHARNAELRALATRLGLGAYDGWDVGRVKTGV